MSLFSPAIKLANRLDFRQKFVFLIIITAISLLLLFRSLYLVESNKKEVIEYQLQATEFIAPVRLLVEHVAQTRGMTNAFLNGNDSFETKIMSKREQVEKDFIALLNVNKKLGKEFNVEEIPAQLNRSWTKITSSAFNRPAPEVFTAYTQLIAELIDFMDTMARSGKMQQDPDPANSFIINTLTQTLPNQVESLGRLRGKGAGVIASQAFTMENKLVVGSLADTRHAKRLAKDMRYLFAENDEIRAGYQSVYDKADRMLNDYLKLADRELIAASSSNMDSADFFAKGTETINSVLALYDELNELLLTRLEKQVADDNFQILAYSFFVLINLLSLTYLYTGMYLAIRRNLNNVISVSNAVCDGDLSTRLTLETKDELQQIATAVNAIVDGVATSMTAVNKASENIAQTAQRIAQSSKSSAEGMELQSSELEVASTAITEMSASVNEVAKNAESGAEASNGAFEVSDRGQQTVNETIDAITQLAENIEVAVSGVTQLEQNSNSITSILDVIKGVAEQTNLLALNAAIEAARAGEQGRGFAVVADEVRTLAKRTQSSTHEIQAVIELIQTGIHDVAASMNKSQNTALKAVEQSKQAGNALQEISSSVSTINDMSAQIATAAEEQSCVSDEVAQSIVKISDVAQQASKNSQNLAEAGSQLAAMSSEMALVVGRYQLDEKHGSRIPELLTWTNQLSIGVPEADRQHKQMITMMNDVHALAGDGRSSEAIAKSLDSLIDYTGVHFKWEEEFLESHNYSGLAAHRQEHAKLLSELRQYQKELEVTNLNEVDNVLKKLNNWLVGHIQNSDADYAREIQL